MSDATSIYSDMHRRRHHPLVMTSIRFGSGQTFVIGDREAFALPHGVRLFDEDGRRNVLFRGEGQGPEDAA